jgi:hypothetical protein
VLAKDDGFISDSSSTGALLPGQYIDCVPQNIMVDAQGKHTVIDKEWQLTRPVEVNHLVFRSMVFLCDAITRFGRPATGENLTVYRLIERSFKASGLEAGFSDFERYETIETKIQRDVSGINASAFFGVLKTRLLPTQTLPQLLTERDIQIKQLSNRIAELQNSTSWRITRPIRYASDYVRKILVA